jgi:hypothetical protein
MSLYYLGYCLFPAELDGLYPEEREGIDAILDLTEQRIVRQRSISSSTKLRNRDSQTSSTNSEPSEKAQPEGDAHHGRLSKLQHQTSLRDRTLHNIAESDDVFSDEDLTESLV